MKIRNAGKALIVQHGKLLTIKCRDERDEFFILPGGGQEPGETLEQSVRRECMEEVNVDVAVKELLFIREYIGKNHGFRKHYDVHQIDFCFRCTILDGQQPATGHTPDTGQVGIEWIALDALANANFWPRTMREALAELLSSEILPSHSIYLGDIN